MTDCQQIQIEGHGGTVAVHHWMVAEPRCVVLLAHGYGEHARRYDHVALYLTQQGAAVYGPDHVGHGASEGERALVNDIDQVAADLHLVGQRAGTDHPGLPVILLGHSMGGIIAARYAQEHARELAGLILSGPGVGGSPDIEALLGMDPIPDVPIDPETLSRDPEVGRAYAEDPLVWHGPFKRATLQAMFNAVGAIAAGPGLGSLPTLWVHGSDDRLIPVDVTRTAIERLRGDDLEEHIYEGARHEVLNETNQAEVLDHIGGFIDRVLARG